MPMYDIPHQHVHDRLQGHGPVPACRDFQGGDHANQHVHDRLQRRSSILGWADCQGEICFRENKASTARLAVLQQPTTHSLGSFKNSGKGKAGGGGYPYERPTWPSTGLPSPTALVCRRISAKAKLRRARAEADAKKGTVPISMHMEYIHGAVHCQPGDYDGALQYQPGENVKRSLPQRR
jgi:hypothetical protein